MPITPYTRGDYNGEFVVAEARWLDGQKQILREWIPNPIENKHISARALVLCSGDKIQYFNPLNLAKHRGGLLGSKKLQIYGVNEVSTQMVADFAFIRNPQVIEQIADTDIPKKTTCYSLTTSVIKYPGNFYPIPHGVASTDVGTAVYLACFDEHKEVFILNFGDRYDSPKEISAILTMAQSYDTVEFYIVDLNNRMPEVWKNQINIKYMPFREWISYCDISV